ncbi:MAG: hypothetical protein ABIJ52_16815 [Pseudomonadota bacterium]
MRTANNLRERQACGKILANSIIALHCSILSNRWEDFWEHRAAA